ncbi:MAG: hypothetical protein Q8862_09455 [Bacteroidota bacterium]|nr:hypothetical protein [Bacteroidota bacterium]MDP4204593.1 hypothetical protein [Bacteroidota bacterium]
MTRLLSELALLQEAGQLSASEELLENSLSSLYGLPVEHDDQFREWFPLIENFEPDPNKTAALGFLAELISRFGDVKLHENNKVAAENLYRIALLVYNIQQQADRAFSLGREEAVKRLSQKINELL